MKKEEQKETVLLSKVVVLGTVIVGGASQAFAASTLSAPTFALTDVAVVASALLVGLAGFWAIRKGLSLAR